MAGLSNRSKRGEEESGPRLYIRGREPLLTATETGWRHFRFLRAQADAKPTGSARGAIAA